MDLRTYLAAVRKRWPLVVATTLLGAVLAGIAYLLTPPTYASQVQFYVSTPSAPGTSPQAAGQFAESRVNSYVLLLTSEQLGRRVVDSTGVPLSPRAVADRISATAQLNTVVITVTVRDESSQRSLQLAQGVAENFTELVDELDNQGRGTEVVTINTISGPSTSSRPVSPDPLRYLGLGLAAGLLLGLALALLRELLDSSVRSEEVAERVAKAPVVGTIPFDPDAGKAPLIVGEAAGSARAEAYRQLRTNLQFVGAARSAHVLAITSAVPAEGKTLTAVNLALTFVEFGDRVLLIEADLRRPRLAEHLELSREIGLTNVLAGQARTEDAVQAWGSSRLAFLGAGAIPPNPSELLGSARMTEVLGQLRSQFDRIILDTTPVLPVADGVVAASQADAVVLVVHHGKTARAEVARAAHTLEQVDPPVVGVVLNMERRRRLPFLPGREQPYYASTPLPTTDDQSVAGPRLDPGTRAAAVAEPG